MGCNHYEIGGDPRCATSKGRRSTYGHAAGGYLRVLEHLLGQARVEFENPVEAHGTLTRDPMLCCAAEPEPAVIRTSVIRNEEYPRTEESSRFEARS
jgi:hypothetical protein